MSLKEVLLPAINMARKGYPVSPVCSHQWNYTFNFVQGAESERVFKPNGDYPKPGEVFYNPDLATTFESLANKGAKEGFYRGYIADAIVQAIHDYGGVLDKEDLDSHFTAREAPISKVYRGYRVFETPPPTHGLAVLEALGLYEKIVPNPSRANAGEGRSSVDETHKMIECMRLAMADALHYVCDPRTAAQR